MKLRFLMSLAERFSDRQVIGKDLRETHSTNRVWVISEGESSLEIWCG